MKNKIGWIGLTVLIIVLVTTLIFTSIDNKEDWKYCEDLGFEGYRNVNSVRACYYAYEFDKETFKYTYCNMPMDMNMTMMQYCREYIDPVGKTDTEN